MLYAMDDEIRAGDFDAWLRGMVASLRGDAGTEVPCGSCVGCCISSCHIPLRPADRAAWPRIPASALVDAPGLPAGHAMMGYGPDGHCPMFDGTGCTIYPDRPQTCRDYDCRIFAAAGLMAGGPEKRVINERVNAWRFSYADAGARRRHAAIRAAAAFIRDRWQAFPGLCAPTAPTGIAVLALKSHRVFLDPVHDELADEELARAILQASRDFDRPVADGLPGGAEGPQSSPCETSPSASLGSNQVDLGGIT